MADRPRPRSSGDAGNAPGPTNRRTAADAPGHDQQVLIVGGGTGAAVAAGFLDRAGLDPVLARPERGRPLPPVVTLCRPGLELLDRIGLRRPVERRGTTLSRFACRTRGRRWTADTGAPALVAVSRARLDDLLERRLVARVRTVDRPVAALTPTEHGVRATFERGVDELFDAVFTTERRLLPGDESADARAVHRWTGRWPPTAPQPDVPTEAWDDRRAAITVPASGTTFVHLVTAAELPAVDAVGTSDIDARFGHLFDLPVTPFAAGERPNFQYERMPCAAPVSRCADGIALFGAASRQSIPGDCLGAALAVEDAWVFADELASGAGTVADRLARYARRRRRRDAELGAVYDATDASVPRSPPLRRLRAARRAALGPDQPAAHTLARAVPDRL
jgi:2-polyprenyl-6-methoxyphenol hydroxylase-like FAD-dependent oxidoreductase